MTPFSPLLLLGSGAREHALAWRLLQDNPLLHVHIAPGNPGMAHHHPITIHPLLDASSPPHVLALAKHLCPSLVIVGPEIPLAHGVVDALTHHHIPTLGPTKHLAYLETSKSQTKRLLLSLGIPTPTAHIASSLKDALAILEHASFPIVVKPDGLTGGKGVRLCPSKAHALDAVKDALETKKWGAAGLPLLLETFLCGNEFSLTLLCDGYTVMPLPVVQDFKTLHDDPLSPNTGGMGAWSPPPWWRDEFTAHIIEHFALPLLRHLPSPYRGFLYLGMIWTMTGPQLLEINVRPGDPETQAMMPRIGGNLLYALHAAARGTLHRLPPLPLLPRASCVITLASEHYPHAPSPPTPVMGLTTPSPHDSTQWFSGALCERGGIPHTDGGRCISVMAYAPSLQTARLDAWQLAQAIAFKGKVWRADIGTPQDSRSC